eukprot:1714-Heterococcus_DN1.PRE.1
MQGVHIKNGCAWLNHGASDDERRVFARACKKYPQIRAWFSGHFHLSHDFEDSISECGVIGSDSSRDGRRQTRIVSGAQDGLRIYTVSHHLGGEELRLDATIRYQRYCDAASLQVEFTSTIDLSTQLLTNTAAAAAAAAADIEDVSSVAGASKRIVIAHGHQDYDHTSWFSAYTPMPLDGCYMESRDGLIAAGPHQRIVCLQCVQYRSACAVRAQLYAHQRMVVEYDSELLAPLGVVCDKEQLADREVVVVEGGHALLLVPWRITEQDQAPEVVHPNQDGSYWRRRQRNKAVRQAEKAREQLAMEWMSRNAPSSSSSSSDATAAAAAQ